VAAAPEPDKESLEAVFGTPAARRIALGETFAFVLVDGVSGWSAGLYIPLYVFPSGIKPAWKQKR
jgi:hypothetical protein